ncbi:MFS transporter [Kutzneria kofuensis]|uniref:Putative MFS family arabinose efflux permease n=1 Tax=Kutzneria kofuensis TaxID=103725 RepID=A0A7W9NJY7_9PSEU|nr:MFS transporter [Kutzneria kofuensis]MBB5896137.1 putative MFS family arabinose efflux permease [Kutzneria kofuensis]
MISVVEENRTWSYWRVLRDGKVSALLAGDAVTNVGDGAIITALPLLTLRIHGDVPAPLAISAVEAAPYVLATVLAFTIGLTRLRIPPRASIIADCVLRGGLLAGLGLLAMADAITLPVLVCGLLVASVFRMVGMSARRLVVTAMVPPEGRLAANGLLGTSTSLATYAIGPLVGGILAAVRNPGIALLVDGASLILLLAAAVVIRPPTTGSVDGETIPASGLRILRRIPLTARLLVVVFGFNLFYMPVEIALPLLVRGPLRGDGLSLGLIWTGFGVGALIGAMLTGLLRKLPERKLLVSIIAGWAAVVLLLTIAPSVPYAVVVLFVGGLIYAPFTPVVYTAVQAVLAPDEQQPVLTLWTAGSTLAAPIGLALGGPLVQGVGTQGGLLVSALLTIALVPPAAAGLRGHAVRASEPDHVGTADTR